MSTLKICIKTVFISILFLSSAAQAQDKSLKIVLIRHGEKPDNGDNLSCQGLNRALQLPGILVKRFGVPTFTYVPKIGKGASTSRSRPFQTLIPLAIRYNLQINTSYDVEGAEGLAQELQSRKGTVLVCWEHHQIKKIVQALGIKPHKLNWDDLDYDTIYVITYAGGKASLNVQKENLKPKSGCAF